MELAQFLHGLCSNASILINILSPFCPRGKGANYVHKAVA